MRRLVRAFATPFGEGYLFHIERKITNLVQRLVISPTAIITLGESIMEAFSTPSERDLAILRIDLEWNNQSRALFEDPQPGKNFTSFFVFEFDEYQFLHVYVHFQIKRS
jgi:hypothetical protein